jgi:hypothetical protein
MIEGTQAQLVLMKWETNNLTKGPNDDTFGVLGQRYWQFFANGMPMVSPRKSRK